MALAGAAGAGARQDGDLDATFGFFGSSFQFFPGDVSVLSVYVGAVAQPDGKLLVAGTKSVNTAIDFGVLRLMADGSLDTGFGVGGVATAAFDKSGNLSYDVVGGLVQQGDGKIVVAGYGGPVSTGIDFEIARFTSSGLPDNNFGTGGKAVVAFNLGNCAADSANCSDYAQRVSLQNDGKILLAGWAATTSTTSVMALSRLTTSGQPDPTFDGDGKVTVDFSGGLTRGYRARQLADGHIVIAGSALSHAGGGNIDFALAKFDASGQPDATFGVGGKATFGFDVGGGNADIAYDFVELADGKLLVCGTAQITLYQNFDFACERLTADGKPDDAFVPALIPFDIGGDLTDIAYSLAVDSKGRILLAGSVFREPGNRDFGIVRLLPDGSRDYSFGTSGYVRVGSAPLLGTDYTNEAFSVAIQPDEKIVAAGYAYGSNGDRRFQLVRMYGDAIFSDDLDGS